MREKLIEQKLVTAVKARGGIAPKFVSPGIDGMPDRLVLLQNGKMAFVEVKATGLRMRRLQLLRKKQLEGLGFKVFCLNDENKVEEIVNAIQAL